MDINIKIYESIESYIKLYIHLHEAMKTTQQTSVTDMMVGQRAGGATTPQRLKTLTH